jgi:ribosome-binding factor A
MPSRPTRRYPRKLRVDEVVREVLADQLLQLADPRLELVTITGVDVSPDLRHAVVFYSQLGFEDEETADALAAAAPVLKAALGRDVRLKYLPRLAFREDPAIEAGQRVEKILRDLHDGEGAAGVAEEER